MTLAAGNDRDGYFLSKPGGSRIAHVCVECFVVSGPGVLAVVREDKVVKSKFYFCTDNARCITGKFAPVYSNIMSPREFDSNEME